jgi:tRNA A-37 threonylcarbamoyl transferase component Bud32
LHSKKLVDLALVTCSDETEVEAVDLQCNQKLIDGFHP